MWKATVGANINSNQTDDGDWETDPDFVNNVTEQEQRWGSKTIEGSGRTVGAIDMNKLREETTMAHELQKQKQKEANAPYGYGGKFGIEKDRMDKSALGHDYIAKVEKHVSQTDYNTGFGGKFGIQTDRVDKSAVSWDHKENIEKHGSQKDYSSGFGGKFGIEKDRQDKSAVGWDHIEKLHKHDSQTTVSNRDDIIIEQTQKPSQLKAKFESLAKQNEVKPIEKRKPNSVQKLVSAFSNVENTSNKVQETVKNEKSKLEEREMLQRQEEKQREEERQMQEKMKQMKIQEELERQEKLAREEKERLEKLVREEKERQEKRALLEQEELLARQREQELLAQYREQERIARMKEEQELLAQQQEKATSESNVTKGYDAAAAAANEINANVITQEEQLYEPVEESYTAIALYDYQAAADDEISFDPDDIITNIEKIDEGWWRGTCHGITGLFPANYVQLRE